MPGPTTRRRRRRRPKAKAAASSSSRSRTTSSTGSARPIATTPTACASAGCRRRSPAMPPGIVALTTLPTFFGEPQSDSVMRRVGVSIGQNIYTPDDTFTSQPIYNDRPYAAWLYASFALQYTYKRRDEKTGSRGAGAARHAAARPRRDRTGGRRRVRAEQFPQADRRSPSQRLGQPAAQRANDRHRLRAPLAHRPRGLDRGSQARGRFHPAHRRARSATWRSTATSAARPVSARTCATISARRGQGRRCPARKPSSATAASAGTCSPASTARWSAATSSSTATPTATACGLSHRPFVAEAQAGLAITYQRRALHLHAGAAHAGFLSSRTAGRSSARST